MDFIMFSTDLSRNPRWRTLADEPDARLAFLSFMTTKLNQYIGLFQLPLPIYVYDAMMSEHRLRRALATLDKSGMIEFDAVSEVVRIDGWFDERRTPNNAKYLKATIKNFDPANLPRGEIMARSVAELTLAVLEKARTFKVNPKNPAASERHRGEYVGVMLAFLERGLVDIDGLAEAILRKLSGSDPRLSSYLRRLTEELPQLENCGKTIEVGVMRESSSSSERPSQDARNTFGTVSEGFRYPQETLSEDSANGSDTVGEEVEQRSINIDGDDGSEIGPLTSTINSTLAVEARRG
jgi:hypothetical protein